jgi:hypothetical protein
MDIKERSGTAAMGENQPGQTNQMPAAVQARSPLPDIKQPPFTWPPPAIAPSHDTEIRYWGINE